MARGGGGGGGRGGCIPPSNQNGESGTFRGHTSLWKGVFDREWPYKCNITLNHNVHFEP